MIGIAPAKGIEMPVRWRIGGAQEERIGEMEMMKERKEERRK